MKNKVSTAPEKSARQRTVADNWKTQLGYYAMLAVPAAWLFLVRYIPMLGTYLGFIDYKPAKGFFGSDWVGLKHFVAFFSGPDLPRVLRNTLFYNIANITLVSLLCGVLFALMLYEIGTYGIGLFQGLTHWARIFPFLVTGGMSWAFMLALYPLINRIGLIGGNTWKE